MERSSYFYDASTGMTTNQFNLGTLAQNCSNKDVQLILPLKQFIAEIKNPDGKINFYSGVVRLPYYDGELHQFMLWLTTGSGMVYENLFFGVDDLKLKYIYFENDPFVYKLSPEGMQERTFTDQDFNGFDKCPSSSQFDFLNFLN